MAVIATLDSVNVSIAFNSNKFVVSLSLTSIMALATGESYTCSICGYDANSCNCYDSIVCDHGDCDGKVCHYNSDSWMYRCKANGNPYSFCA